MRTLTAHLLAAAILALSVPALAQPDDDDPLAGDEFELEPEPAPGDEDDEPAQDLFADEDPDAPAGSDENPDAPRFPGDEPGDRGDGKAQPQVTGSEAYPIEVVKRPITLLATMSEIALDVPVAFDPFLLTGLLEADYGVSDRIQIGLRYGAGAVTEDGFQEGKSFDIHGYYLIEDWVAAQLSIPVLADPFALGVTLGAPMKFRFFDDKLALTFGRDLLSIAIIDFVPEVENPALTAGLVALEQTGTVLPDGALRFIGGATYQWKPNVALTGEFGLIAQDFSGDDGIYPLQGILTYSSSNKIDLGARAGFSDLGAGTEGLFVAVFAALRIL
jgi:hypothetical protein